MTEPFPLFISWGVGFAIGWMGHAFTVHRERDKRKHDLRGLLSQWRLRLVRASPDLILSVYNDTLFIFASEADKVIDDLPVDIRPAFNDAVETLSSLRESEIQKGNANKQGLEIVVEAIDGVTAFLR